MKPYSTLISPSMALASCVRCYLVRSTLGCALERKDRFNHFPANPICNISWMIQGEWDEMNLTSDTVSREFVDTMTFSGPRTLPLATLNRNEIHFFSVIFTTDVFHALTGINMSAHVDNATPLSSVVDPAWITMAQAVMEAPSDEARMALIEDFLAPRWQQVRSNKGHISATLEDWVHHLTIRAATSGIGKSLRQAERRIKEWAGLPQRELQNLGRMEALLLKGRPHVDDSTMAWAEVAAMGGFADQSHMCRMVRRFTGHTPAEIRRGIKEDESFWLYRIWG